MTSIQVHVRKPCEDCGGHAVVLDPDWAAYYTDHQQQLAEDEAMRAAPMNAKLDARLAMFHLWWAKRLGCMEELAATGAVPILPPTEIPCGTCVDGWVERWMPAEQIVPVAA